LIRLSNCRIAGAPKNPNADRKRRRLCRRVLSAGRARVNVATVAADCLTLKLLMLLLLLLLFGDIADLQCRHRAISAYKAMESEASEASHDG